MTQVELEPLEGEAIRLHIQDLDYTGEFTSLHSLLKSDEPSLGLVQNVLQHFKPAKGFILSTSSQSPVGAGLGGSSSLCMGLIEAFRKWCNEDMSLQEQVSLAANVEARMLRTPTGTQDYFPAVRPGLNLIHYSLSGPRLETLDVDLDTISEHMLLVYTGRSHNSGINNWQVLKAAIDGDSSTLYLLKEFASISSRVAESCKNQKWHELPELFHREFEARSKISSAFTSPEIEQLHSLVLNAGADAVKICGAGGGGCVLVWTPANHRQQVADACARKGFQVLDAKPFNKPEAS
jgi:D-glycero-alpha-D-manno-heptose-7-phosphate kinase